ncbi:MAG: holo-ACP synthase [Gemmatimonadales bacterium]|nr:holo-ACP synthase [Gemmatimonadales bacterium]
MSVAGVGVDVVDVARARGIMERHGERALRRFLTDAERDYVLRHADPAQAFAVRLAAKEAVYKALAEWKDQPSVTWRHIEVARLAGGKPRVLLHGAGLVAARGLGITAIHLSLSHSTTSAIAMAVLERGATR